MIVTQYILQVVPLSVTSIFKYLGITISDTLTWNDHVNAVVSKANRTLGFMWQIAGGSSTKALTSLYKFLVLPVLEYGLPAWSPYTSASISKLERVQRRASRMCLKQRKGTMTYEDRLHALNWISLDSRRQKHTLTFTTKCLFGLIDCHTIKLNTVVNTRHQSILDTARTLALKNTPCHSFPRIWSSLPSHIKNSMILDSFKCFN